MMKYLLLFCLAPYLSRSQEVPTDANAIWDSVADGHYQECADEFGIDRAIGRDFLRNLYLPDTRAFHCFLRCLYKSTDFLNADGDFDIEVVVYKAHFLPYDLTEQCITESHMQPDLCDRAYTAAACAVSGLSGMDREALKVPRN
ncbi:uncharacterized protein LOC116174888 [Photinus pyralis]|uniref:uncharacterized protein LOC116174888 n=1 Tax=Photinus pyralis TaxID=7054 RepID=UPI001266F234|nr:uncharacterized protein LOC116174888 [Photinus pyralis]